MSARARAGTGDLTEQLTAQRAWLALLRGDSAPSKALTEREWRMLADEASRHHLRGVTYRRLADGPAAARVTAEVRERLRSYYLETTARNAVLYRQISEIVKELASKAIPVMLLKGIHLSRFVYAEPGLRSMADVDIMVRREHLAEAERVFIARGFGPSPRPHLEEWCAWNHHLAKLEKPGAPIVELHWNIQRPGSPFPIDLDGLWHRSRAATLDGAPVRLLSAEDLLLHLALHLSQQHHFKRAALKGLTDIATVIAAEGEALDWRALAERAISWKISAHLYTTLRLTTEILATPVPPWVLALLPRQPAGEKIVDVARRYILMLHVVLPTAYPALARGGSLGERMRLLWGAVYLPRARMESLYGLRAGTPFLFPYYGRRLASLIWRRGGLVLNTLLGTRVIQQTLDREQDQQRLERWTTTPPS